MAGRSLRHVRKKMQLRRRRAEPPLLSEEATARVAASTEKLRLLVGSVPGLLDDLQEILSNVTDAYGLAATSVSKDFVKQVAETPVTLDYMRSILQVIGQQLIEQGIQIGREETLHEYALEALAGAAEEDEEEPVAASPLVPTLPLGDDPGIDADFEEA